MRDGWCGSRSPRRSRSRARPVRTSGMAVALQPWPATSNPNRNVSGPSCARAQPRTVDEHRATAGTGTGEQDVLSDRTSKCSSKVPCTACRECSARSSRTGSCVRVHDSSRAGSSASATELSGRLLSPLDRSSASVRSRRRAAARSVRPALMTSTSALRNGCAGVVPSMSLSNNATQPPSSSSPARRRGPRRAGSATPSAPRADRAAWTRRWQP